MLGMLPGVPKKSNIFFCLSPSLSTNSTVKGKLHIIKWVELDKWIIPKYLIASSNLPNDWILVRVGELVTQITDRIKVESDKEYKMVGIKWYGEGTFHRETAKGNSLSATYIMPLSPNAFIYNRLFAWKGSFAVVPDEHADCFVSNEFPQFIVNEERVLLLYLYLFFMCNSTIEAVNKVSIGSAAVSRNRFKEEDFLNFKIPLPPLKIQKNIIEHWQTAQKKIRTAIDKVTVLEKNVTASVFEDIGITLFPLEKRPKSFLISWNELERWGVEFNRWKWKLSDLLLSHKYPMITLYDVALLNPTENIFLNDDELVSFIPMEAVSDKSGEIISPRTQKYREVKNGYTCFKNDDVVWAKITPCMQNGKCTVAKSLLNGIGFGSTEFHVVRSKNNEKLLPEYIWILLRLNHLRQAAQRYFIGSAGQQRVPVDFLAKLRIPLPPINEQHSIVNKVNECYSEIAYERAAAERKSREIKEEIEALILGSKVI